MLTLRTARKGKRTARAPKPLTTEQKHKIVVVADTCDECIAKLKFHHSNRTTKGRQEFVDLLVDVLTFAASKHPEDTRKSLNALPYKGKIQLKDTSKNELARFARKAYADTRFMSRRKSEKEIVVHVLGTFLTVRSLTHITNVFFVDPILKPHFNTGENDLTKKISKVVVNSAYSIINALGYYIIYFLSRSQFQKNASRLHEILDKH